MQKCEPVKVDATSHAAWSRFWMVSTARNDVMEAVDHEIRSGTFANDWILRLEGDDQDVERLVGDILRHLRDRALLIA